MNGGHRLVTGNIIEPYICNFEEEKQTVTEMDISDGVDTDLEMDKH